MTALEKPGTGAKAKRSHGRNRRWPALLGGLVLAALKSEVLVKLILHRGELVAVLVVVVVISLLRARPVGIAVGTSLLLAFVVGAHSLGLGLALGFGGVALLMAVFFAISTMLLARQNRTAAGANVP